MNVVWISVLGIQSVSTHMEATPASDLHKFPAQFVSIETISNPNTKK